MHLLIAHWWKWILIHWMWKLKFLRSWYDEHNVFLRLIKENRSMVKHVIYNTVIIFAFYWKKSLIRQKCSIAFKLRFRIAALFSNRDGFYCEYMFFVCYTHTVFEYVLTRQVTSGFLCEIVVAIRHNTIRYNNTTIKFSSTLRK